MRQSRRNFRSQQDEEEEEEGDEEEQDSEHQQPDSTDLKSGNQLRITDDTLDASNLDLINEESRKLKGSGKKEGKQSSNMREMNIITSGN